MILIKDIREFVGEINVITYRERGVVVWKEKKEGGGRNNIQ